MIYIPTEFYGTSEQSNPSSYTIQMKTSGLNLCMILFCCYLFVLKSSHVKKSFNRITYNDFYEKTSQCKWTYDKSSPDVYWINMDKSIQRRQNMLKHFRNVGLVHHRVKGLSRKDFYLPLHLQNSWWDNPNRKKSNILNISKFSKQNFNGSDIDSYPIIITELFGRKKNKLNEIGCTISHILAIYEAIHSATSKSHYAIILEDDVTVPLNINFNDLIQTAPSDFSILQIFNSCVGSMIKCYKEYQTSNQLWVLRKHNQRIDFWATCGYIINKQKLKSIIDSLIIIHKNWIEIKLIAHYEACTLPCIAATRGFQADSFIYALATTYVLSVPIITNGIGFERSTFHQDHVLHTHQFAFNQQRIFINQLLMTDIDGDNKPIRKPSFISPACGTALLPLVSPFVDNNTEIFAHAV